MRQYKIIADILLILPVINFAFALPIAVQETRQLCGDVIPDVAITMSAKRGDETGKQSDVYIESLSGNPESLSTAHPPSGSAQSESDHGPMNGHAPSQSPTSSPSSDHVVPPELSRFPILEHYMVTQPQLSRFPILEQYMTKSPVLGQYMVPPELSKSPLLDQLIVPPEQSKFPILEHYMVTPPKLSNQHVDQHVVPSEPSKSPSLDHHAVASTNSSGSSGWSTANSPMENEIPNSESSLSKVLNKVKFSRRISGPGFVSDAVDAAQRELQGLLDTGAKMERLS